MIQLAFPFMPPVEAAPPPSRTTLYWRRKVAKSAAYAFELGRRRGIVSKRAARSLSSAAAIAPTGAVMGTGRAPLTADARHKVELLARRVGRLSISRHDPEHFFVERDLIYRELLSLSRR